MFSQSQIKALELLDKCFSETPEHIIESDIRSVTELGFVGTPAKDYFAMFHKHFNYEPFKINLSKYRVKNTATSILLAEETVSNQLEAIA